MSENGEQWYNNKELFEMFQGVKTDLLELRVEMKETREIIKKYNGLRDEIGKAQNKIDDLEHKIDLMDKEKKDKANFGKAFRDWGGWIIALLALLAAIVSIFH